MRALEPFIGQWRMAADFEKNPDAPPLGLTSFEWLVGEHFLVQRWEIEHPEAPDGMAIIAFDAPEDTYLQHYFDSRGIARTYYMEYSSGVWVLERIALEPDFSQRFTGRFSEDGNVIAGTWDISNDGSTWTKDFELTYFRVE